MNCRAEAYSRTAAAKSLSIDGCFSVTGESVELAPIDRPLLFEGGIAELFDHRNQAADQVLIWLALEGDVRTAAQADIGGQVANFRSAASGKFLQHDVQAQCEAGRRQMTAKAYITVDDRTSRCPSAARTIATAMKIAAVASERPTDDGGGAAGVATSTDGQRLLRTGAGGGAFYCARP